METPNSLLQSNTLRFFLTGVLTVALFIPLLLVQNLIAERAQRQREVTHEIAGGWGNSVTVYGPILKIPYNRYEETVTLNQHTKQTTTQKTATVQYAYFFPEQLRNKATAKSSVKSRGNYDCAVFTSKMDVSGNFLKPDFGAANIAAQDVLWDKATVLIKTSNTEGIANAVQLNLDGKSYAFGPVFESGKDSLATLETGPVDAAALQSGKLLDFAFTLTYKGSGAIRMVPVGKTTLLEMASNWPSPKFSGNFLPGDTNKKIGPEGFTAQWKVLHLNRAFGQQYFDSLPNLSKFAFGVDFYIPVDQYQQNERAAKYGFLVIGLTFLIFFLIQVMSKIKMHLFHYTMIGLALVLFYTLLISITEHSSFALAYAVASVAVVAMIGLYALSILKSRKFAGFVGLALATLYAFVYVIIQLEDYALLFGSLGLFAILGAVMYFSRKIEWN